MRCVEQTVRWFKGYAPQGVAADMPGFGPYKGEAWLEKTFNGELSMAKSFDSIVESIHNSGPRSIAVVAAYGPQKAHTFAVANLNGRVVVFDSQVDAPTNLDPSVWSYGSAYMRVDGWRPPAGG